MSRLDDELRNALRRQEPPAGFAQRVLARVSADPSKPARAGWRPGWLVPGWRWAAALAIAAIVLVGGLSYRYEQQRRRQGEQARQQVLTALRITGAKVHRAQQMVKQISANGSSARQRGEGL